MTSEAQKRAFNKYQREKCVSFNLKLNKEHDAAVIEILQSANNRQGFIKALVEAAIIEADANGYIIDERFKHFFT